MGFTEERCDREEFAGPLAVGGRDDGRVDVVELLLLKKLVHSKGKGAAHARHRSVRVRAPAQVWMTAQKIERKAPLGEGIELRRTGTWGRWSTT